MNELIPRKLILLNQDVSTSMLTCDSAWTGFCDSRLAEYTGIAPVMYGEVVRGETINWYMDPSLMEKMIVSSRTALFEKPDLMATLKRGTEDVVERISEHARRAFETLDTEMPAGHISMLLENKRLYHDISFFGSVIAYADVDGGIAERNIGVLAAKIGKDNPLLQKYLHELSTPNRPSLSEEATRRIREDIGEEDALKEYFWLNQGYIGRGLTKAEFDFLRTSAPLLEYEASSLSELSLSPEEQRGFDIAKELIYLKSLRADTRQFLNVVTNRILDLYASRWNMNQLILSTMTLDELVGAIRKDAPPNAELSERVAHSLYIWNGEGYVIYIGAEVDEVLAGTLPPLAEQGAEIKGQVAQPGKVSGRVRVVFNSNHNSRVEAGDVLVAIATSPQFLPAMARASAFITDVGGITSHAAIVAREMKKPCIVGTKVATQILRDGDTVEVDANTGVVTILKHDGV